MHSTMTASMMPITMSMCGKTTCFIFAPVTAGEPVGAVGVFEYGCPICEAELFVKASVGRDEDDSLPPWKRFWKNWAKRCSGSFQSGEFLV